MKLIFDRLVQEFDLVVSETPYCCYAKIKGIHGFLLALQQNLNLLMVADDVDKNEEGRYFYGAAGFDSYQSTKEQVCKLLSKAKELLIDEKIEDIKTDFK